MSGIFFSGPPQHILQAWKQEAFALLVSPPILMEYQRVGEELTQQFQGIDITRILHILTTHSQLVQEITLPQQICQDPDDDKFLACALAGNCRLFDREWGQSLA